MNSNNPSEQRAYQRRLKRLQARDRRWKEIAKPADAQRTHNRRRREISAAYAEIREERHNVLERNRTRRWETDDTYQDDDGGLDS